MNALQSENLDAEIQNAIRRIVAERAVENLNENNNDNDDDSENANPACMLNLDRDIFMAGNDDISQEDLDEAAKERMSDECYQSCMASLNVLQNKLMRKVTNVLKDPSSHPPLRLFITGGAGSGKSFTLKLIRETILRLCNPDILQQGKDPVKVGAPTGVAGKLVGGTTLHRLVRLPVDDEGMGKNVKKFTALTGEYLEKMRQIWAPVNWLIIDEVSMVPYKNLCRIHLRLQQLKNSTEPFGGLNILAFGDLMQLPPVKASPVFEVPHQYQSEPNLWHLFGFVELTTIMHQKNDSEFVDILNNLRVGTLTLEQLEVLNSRKFEDVNLSGEFDEAVRVFPTTKQVSAYNEKMCNKLIEQGVRMYNLTAVDRSLDAATNRLIANPKTVPTKVNKTGGFLKNLQLSVGARVMLRRNQNISRGLVNGSMGTVRQFVWPALCRDQMEDGDLPK